MKEQRASRSLWQRAQRSLAGGVSSNVRADGQPPLYFSRAEGAHLFDVDGNAYLDYVLGQGPMLLGHAPEPIIEAVTAALRHGQLYAGQHELEIRLSEKMQRLIPCAEQVRYGSSGSEVVQAALRTARAYTGRVKVIKFEGHYHGWFDNVLVSVHPSPEAAGPREAPRAVPGSSGQLQSQLAEIIVLPWNDLAIVERLVDQQGEEIAAVIMEPVMCNSGCIAPLPGYLEGVRNLCSNRGIVLIFDEIITGFRLALGGAQSYFNVKPDLATFGKAMASGFPIGCLAGKKELMELIADKRVNHSGTFNSNVACMAAAWATLTFLEDNQGGVYEHLFQRGGELMAGIRWMAGRRGWPALVQGLGPMFHLAFSEREALHEYRDLWACDVERYHHLVGLLLQSGIRVLPRGLWYLSTAHRVEDVELTLGALERSLEQLVTEQAIPIPLTTEGR